MSKKHRVVTSRDILPQVDPAALAAVADPEAAMPDEPPPTPVVGQAAEDQATKLLAATPVEPTDATTAEVMSPSSQVINDLGGGEQDEDEDEGDGPLQVAPTDEEVARKLRESVAVDSQPATPQRVTGGGRPSKITPGILTAAVALEMQGQTVLGAALRKGNRGTQAVTAGRQALMRHNPDMISQFEKEVADA